MCINEDTAALNCYFALTDRKSHTNSEFEERHITRYFFIPELFLALWIADLEPLAVVEWMTGREPGRQTWNIAVVARG